MIANDRSRRTLLGLLEMGTREYIPFLAPKVEQVEASQSGLSYDVSYHVVDDVDEGQRAPTQGHVVL